MKLIELFAGSCTVTNVAKEIGFETFTTDIHPFEGIDLVKNILDVSPSDFPFIPDIVWASPPCTFFSVASIGKHWHKNHMPKTAEAVLGMDIVTHTLKLVSAMQVLNPNLIYFIENPRGKLRKMGFMQDLGLKEVSYCRYGETRMKPTDIWTNSKTWIPRPMCHNGNSDHVSAPRGSQTGTQGMGTAYEKAKIPTELAKEVLEDVIRNEKLRKRNMTTEILKEHVDGLYLLSETDSYWQVFAPTSRRKEEITCKDMITMTELEECNDSLTFDSYFEHLIRSQTISQGKEVGQLYTNLLNIMVKLLTDRQVYKMTVSPNRYRYYIIGVDSQDTLVGVYADSVET